jgi:hypothetical protein
VVIGTWSPTCSTAGWLSSTTRDGGTDLDVGQRLQRIEHHARLGFGPSSRLKPGSVRAKLGRIRHARAAIAAGAGIGLFR